MYTRRQRPQQAPAYAPYAQSYQQSFSPFSAEPDYYEQSYRPSYSQYQEFEEPEFDELAYEEERLIEAQRQIDAQRRRIAEERRRVAEDRRRQELLIQREAERRAELLYQQRIAKQQQQQAVAFQRQRQAASREAQLEAALRDIERQDAYDRRHAIASERRQAAQTAQEPQNPLELLLGLFAPSTAAAPSAPAPAEHRHHQFSHPCAQRCVDRRQQQQTAQQNATPAYITIKPIFKSAAAPSAPTSSATPVSKKVAPISVPFVQPKSAPAAPAPKVSSLLSTLRARVDAATAQVSSLLTTTFDKLTLGHFGIVDSELMNILLALDDVNAHSEEARESRKSLVKEIVGLLERVDQRKEAYSSSSSEASEDEKEDDSESGYDSEDQKALLEESEEELEKVEQDEEVAEIDADSEGSDVEDADSAPASGPASTDADVNFEQLADELVATQVADSASEPITQLDDAPEDYSSLIDFSNSFAEAKEEVAAEEAAEAEYDESAAIDAELEAFGLKGLKDIAPAPSTDSNPDYHVNIPIKVRGSKSTVTIESAPSTSQ